MSEAQREEKIRALLGEILALSNVEPRGVVAHSAVTVPYPVPKGSKLIFGALQGGSHMDGLLTVETSRRIGMGTYRIFFGLLPEPPAAVVSAGASS